MHQAAAFAAAFAALYAAHQVADHWIQTQHQATHKDADGWAGRINCAAHVATYTLVAVVALTAVSLTLDLPFAVGQTMAGLTVSGVSHFIIDRRASLRWLAGRLGKDAGWLEHGGGLYALDQSAHVGFLFVASLLVAA